MVNADIINPFLKSASNVIEQIAQIRPTNGKLELKEIKLVEEYIWIHIGINGEKMNGDILYGLHQEVALKMVSVMMGGFQVTELDEMSQSAIAEMGNMISGNASAMLYEQGVAVDITPPKVYQSNDDASFAMKKALTIPMFVGEIGQFDIQVIVA